MTALIPDYILYPAVVAVSAIISIYAARKIIFITGRRKIYDVPDNIRKIHGDRIPSLGGIGIFAGYIITSAFFMYLQWYYVVAASVILFFTGIYDDIMNMRPSKKLVAQIVASAIVVFLADVRIRSFYGIAGIYELSYAVSVSLTVFLCAFFINVFNFMDGIDGLACVLTILYTAIPAALFIAIGEQNLAGISLSLMGATIGLLFYNIAPARIYMGDTGSMMLGLTIFTISVSAVNLYDNGHSAPVSAIIHSSQSAVLMVVAMLLLPVFDAVRVFMLRMAKGVSPFHADRSHVHYYLLDAGFSHTAAVAIITSASLAIMVSAWLLQNYNPLLVVLTLAGLLSLVMWILASYRRKKLLFSGK